MRTDTDCSDRTGPGPKLFAGQGRGLRMDGSERVAEEFRATLMEAGR